MKYKITSNSKDIHRGMIAQISYYLNLTELFKK